MSSTVFLGGFASKNLCVGSWNLMLSSGFRQRLLWSFSLHWATKSTVSKNLRMAIGCTARLSLAVVEPLIEHAPLHDNRSVIS